MKKILLPLDPADHSSFKDAATDAKIPLVQWIRQACISQLTGAKPPPTRSPNPFPHLPKSKYQPSKDCDAPGDRCKRFGAPTCEPCRKAFEAKEVRS